MLYSATQATASANQNQAEKGKKSLCCAFEVRYGLSQFKPGVSKVGHNFLKFQQSNSRWRGQIFSCSDWMALNLRDSALKRDKSFSTAFDCARSVTTSFCNDSVFSFLRWRDLAAASRFFSRFSSILIRSSSSSILKIGSQIFKIHEFQIFRRLKN